MATDCLHLRRTSNPFVEHLSLSNLDSRAFGELGFLYSFIYDCQCTFSFYFLLHKLTYKYIFDFFGYNFVLKTLFFCYSIMTSKFYVVF